AEVLKTIGRSAVDKLTKMTLPTEVENKIRSYKRFENNWASADDRLLALIAVADLMGTTLETVSRQDENELLAGFGVDVFSSTSTEDALIKMQDFRKDLDIFQLKMDAMRDLGRILSKRSVVTDFFNASQILLDESAYDELEWRCKLNVKA